MVQTWTDDGANLFNTGDTSLSCGINGKDDKEAKKVTKDFAETMHHRTPELQHRTVTAVTQRLPYLDNLLAGAWEIHNYAQKDQALYHTKPRPSMSRKPNLCNTRHSYNGALNP